MSPKDPRLFPRLLDATIAPLVDERDAQAALWAAGVAVQGTPWQGYRPGRIRLATAAAVYLTWLAPPEDWQADGALIVDDRRAFRWRHNDGRSIVDLLVGDERASGLVNGVFQEIGSNVAMTGVRALNTAAPRRSTLWSSRSKHMLLVDSDLWFEEQR